MKTLDFIRSCRFYIHTYNYSYKKGGAMEEPKKKYACPEHNEIILFEGEVDSSDFRYNVKIDPPAYCDKCGKYYFRHECKVITNET